ncbi:hypothetical protein [Leadbetterella sp. DM7]|uniref:hypothetical protein n=1 Tax=Leadbetterella sp. DM7 TaxID=3235085 RepID=UPI00349EC6E8
MKKTIILFTLLLSSVAYCQEKTIDKDSIIARSVAQAPSFWGSGRDLSTLVGPNAAAFEKYANVPVNYNTGQVSYALPLMTLVIDDELRIPVTLAYSNSGLKPAEIPSWTGNGWDVNVGGTIVQYHKGLDDFSTSGLQLALVRSKLDSYHNGTLTGASKYDYLWQVAEQNIDSQFDVFSLHFLGRSNSFYFDRDTVKFFNKEPLKVEFASNVFTVTDEAGYRYIFGIRSLSSGSYQDDTYGGMTFTEGASTWFLTKIVTPAGREVTLVYAEDSGYEIYESRRAYSSGTYVSGYTCPVNSAYTPHYVISYQFIGQRLLNRIDYPGGKLEFQLTNRNDLQSPVGVKSKALQAIRHRNINNQVIGKALFQYGYMDALSQDRLQLNSVSLSGTDTTLTQTWAFDYYPSSGPVPIPGLVKPGSTNVPNHAVDYRGYYNGQTSNTDKVPRYNYSSLNPYNTLGTVAGGANRHPDAIFSRWGMLRKITYPDKGYDWLEYETNKYKKSVGRVSLYEAEDTENYYTELFRSVTGVCDTVIQDFTLTSAVINAQISLHIQSNSSPVTIRIQRLSDMTYVVNTTQSPAEEWENTLIVSLPAGGYRYEIQAPCNT